jgi:hypothetical protein
MDLKDAVNLLSQENLTINQQRELAEFFHTQKLGALNNFRSEFSLKYPNKLELLDYIVTTPIDKIGVINDKKKEYRITNCSLAYNIYKEMDKNDLIDKTNKYVGVNEDGTVIYGESLVAVVKKVKKNAYCCATNGNPILMPTMI